ncbi:SchA/CurD-like domain-containing protein [Streptomyces sp. NPDC096176]|uniref:SchA/CurD-like domain-containing protein n=1 Tax=Streptomyces sp. NPDC096176 TaxID=3366079 RepID=UPI0038202540
MTIAASDRVSISSFDGAMLRVVLLMDLHEGTEPQFLAAYDQLCDQVASVPGHISDQLCQSIENPSQWLITSEWQSAVPFLSWVNSDEHLEMVKPLSVCARSTRSFRYSVLRETGTVHAAPRRMGRLQTAPRVSDGLVRSALTFTVKPGSEQAVAGILADYASPQARVDAHTRLHRTSLFMHGNRVVRTIEVRGDLMAALHHVARQPEVRAVEDAINPYLEVERDLDDPESARMFFMRAALPTVHHVMADRPDEAGIRRMAVIHQVEPGQGMGAARALAEADEAEADRPDSLVAASTIFQRDNTVVRLLDVRGELEEPVSGKVMRLVTDRHATA